MITSRARLLGVNRVSGFCGVGGDVVAGWCDILTSSYAPTREMCGVPQEGVGPLLLGGQEQFKPKLSRMKNT